MRIGLTSDVHVDITPTNQHIVPHLVEAAHEADLDVLIICGDVSPSLMHLARFLAAFEPLSCAKFFVAGNHDIWVVTYDNVTSRQKYQVIDAICEECSFHHLAARPQVVGGVGFCGTIGWYDYGFRASQHGISLTQYAGKQWEDHVWQDGRYARWDMPDPEFAQECAETLRAQLQQLPASVEQIVAAIHHVPFRECVAYRDQLPWDFFSAFMGSEALGKVCLEDSRVRHVVFGHTHAAIDRPIQRVRAIASPIGYLVQPPPEGLAAYARRLLAVFELPTERDQPRA